MHRDGTSPPPSGGDPVRASRPPSGGDSVLASRPPSGGDTVRASRPPSGGDTVRASPPPSGGDTVRASYDVFAAFYDDFTRDHDHEDWTATLEAVARRHGLAGRRLLDVGCGTGGSFLPMLDRGYEVTACDLSPRMVERSRAKAGGRARVLEADMLTLPELGSFDLVWSLGDAVNYLRTPEELEAAFAALRRNLAPHGVLLFDANTLHAFASYLTGLHVSPGADRVFVLEGHGDPDPAPGADAEVWIDRLQRDPSGGGWSRLRSVHRHRHHPRERLCAALERAGLRCLQTLGSHPTGVLDAELDERRHLNAIYVTRAA